MSIGLKIVKGIMYVLLCVVAVIIVIMLVMLAYNTAMNTMNVSMIIKDAMAKRAEIILMPSGDEIGDREMLEKLFTARAIADDDAYNQGYYDDFTITNYYEHADVEFKIVWPWEEETTLEVTETVRDIEGGLIEKIEGPDGELIDQKPLGWANGVYELEMKKDKLSETWRINSMKMLQPVAVEEDAEEEPEDGLEAEESDSAEDVSREGLGSGTEDGEQEPA